MIHETMLPTLNVSNCNLYTLVQSVLLDTSSSSRCFFTPSVRRLAVLHSLHAHAGVSPPSAHGS